MQEEVKYGKFHLNKEFMNFICFEEDKTPSFAPYKQFSWLKLASYWLWGDKAYRETMECLCPAGMLPSSRK